MVLESLSCGFCKVCYHNCVKTDTISLLDNSPIEKVSEGEIGEKGKGLDNVFIKKSKNPMLSGPKLISKIDSKLIRKPIECAKYAVWHKTEHYYVPLPCKKWDCSVCGEKNAKLLHKRLSQSDAVHWKIKRHIILTVAEDAISSNLSELLNDFIKDLRRNGFPNLKYIWVKEFQYERFLKSGIWWRHIHMVVNVDISKYNVIPYWNKQNKNKFNMVEVRKVRNFRNGSYLTKYFTKEKYQQMFDKQERRYGSSEGVLPKSLKKAPSGDWEFMILDEARNLHDAYDIDKNLELIIIPKNQRCKPEFKLNYGEIK